MEKKKKSAVTTTPQDTSDFRKINRDSDLASEDRDDGTRDEEAESENRRPFAELDAASASVVARRFRSVSSAVSSCHKVPKKK